MRSLFALLLTLLLLAPPAAAVDADYPDGATCECERLDAVDNDYSQLRPPVEVRYLSQYRLRFERAGSGWRVHKTFGDFVQEADGQVVENPLFDAMEGGEITLVLDPEGRATSVQGFRGIVREMERTVPVEIYSRFSEGGGQSSLETGEAGDWDRQLHWLRGEDLAVGERWRVRVAEAVEGAEIPVEGILEVVSREAVDGREQMRVRFEFDNQGEAVAAAGEVDRVQDELDPTRDWAGNNMVVRGTREQLLDAATGIVLEDVAVRTAQLPMGTADGPKATFGLRRELRCELELPSP